jgi:UDP-N-acetylglucosamine 2-epimerase
MGYQPNYVLSSPYSIGKAIDETMEIIIKENVDIVLVNGDTAGALVGSLAAMYSDKKIAHVEAGLRSFDPYMYEERNRIMVDSMAHYLLTYTDKQAEMLMRTPCLRGDITNVGNTTVDLINDFKEQIDKLPEFLKDKEAEPFFYVTLHRKEFTDYPSRINEVFSSLKEITEKSGIRGIFPMHPRTKDACRLNEIDYKELLGDRIDVIEPVDAFSSMFFEKNSMFIITDSGCIQEEACIFNTPCITVRNNTERPETLFIGANVVTGFVNEWIVKEALNAYENVKDNGKVKNINVYGSVGVGDRIVDIINK